MGDNKKTKKKTTKKKVIKVGVGKPYISGTGKSSVEFTGNKSKFGLDYKATGQLKTILDSFRVVYRQVDSGKITKAEGRKRINFIQKAQKNAIKNDDWK